MEKKILLLEDDGTLGYVLKEYLQMKGFPIVWCKDGKTALRAFDQHQFDLCILDIMLPDTDGFTIAQAIKLKDAQCPILFLSARSLKVDKLKGFNLGAEDYITKPVDEEELVARINVILRRNKKIPISYDQFNIGLYQFDYSNQELTIEGQPAKILTEKEAMLLKLLCQSKGKLLSRKLVLNTIWNKNDYFNRRSMDVFISRLRKYLSQDPAIQIENVYGSGFILKVAPS